MSDQFDAGTHKTATPAQTRVGTKGPGSGYYWLIEYEIPPLRAIYQAEADGCSEEEIRKIVSEEEPLWRIRRLIYKQRDTPNRRLRAEM